MLMTNACLHCQLTEKVCLLVKWKALVLFPLKFFTGQKRWQSEADFKSVFTYKLKVILLFPHLSHPALQYHPAETG